MSPQPADQANLTPWQRIMWAAIGLSFTGLIAAFAISANAQSGWKASSGSRSQAATDSTGVAVVELFTSQGCSSCPAADATLRGIDSAAQKDALPVYVLSFHVDYWNRLGWKDPYSSADFSKRQYQYASALGSSQVYTPQMIVGGTNEFVGSSRSKAVGAVSDALATPSTTSVNLKVTADGSLTGITIDYAIDGTTTGQVLNVAAVQTPDPNRVSRGENSGRTLSHVNVVRAYKTVKLSGATGRVVLSLPSDFRWETGGLIAYVQNPRAMKISGATSVAGLTP